jgi:glycosyltransferase involved in cell wall biosynthesis
MTPVWRAAIEAFMQDQPDVHWLLIGADGHLPGQLPTGPRIHVLPSQNDLMAWLRLADIYLNPPRIGGGTSVALAMQAGLPVLALTGGDGGDKLGGDAVADMATYMQRLTHWVQDPAARLQAGGQAQTRFVQALDLSSELAQERLVQACCVTVQRFGQRSQSAP